MSKKTDHFDQIMNLFGKAEGQIHKARKDYVKQQKKAVNIIDELLGLVEEIPVTYEEDD